MSVFLSPKAGERMSFPENDRARQKKMRCVTESIEGLSSFLAHVAIKGKTKETKRMARKLAKKMIRIAKDLGGTGQVR